MKKQVKQINWKFMVGADIALSIMFFGLIFLSIAYKRGMDMMLLPFITGILALSWAYKDYHWKGMYKKKFGIFDGILVWLLGIMMGIVITGLVIGEESMPVWLFNWWAVGTFSFMTAKSWIEIYLERRKRR